MSDTKTKIEALQTSIKRSGTIIKKLNAEYRKEQRQQLRKLEKLVQEMSKERF